MRRIRFDEALSDLGSLFAGSLIGILTDITWPWAVGMAVGCWFFSGVAKAVIERSEGE